MPVFEYKAFAAGGAVKTGVVDADTAREARNRLRRDSILVTEIRELRGTGKTHSSAAATAARPRRAKLSAALSKLRRAPSGPSSRDIDLLSAITRQLGTLLGAGIPLAEALRAIIDQADTRRVETMFRTIRERITQGASLGEALSEHPGMFSDLYVNMIKAGEATGHVDIVLNRLADFLQRQRKLSRQVVSALIYPALMITLGIAVVSFLMAFVVPKITAMLADQNKELPVPTQILVSASWFFQHYWFVGCLAIAAVSFLIERVYKSDWGRLFLDRLMLRTPLIGELLRKAAVARFTRTLSTLLESGVPAVQSLEITQNVVGNQVIANATGEIRKRILEGTDIATPLRATGVFPSAVTYMVSVGEKSGELEKMLDRVADAYDEEVEIVTERLTSLLEPIMIILLAVVVGYIVLSIILPILQATSLT